jgi:hypothetical protein
MLLKQLLAALFVGALASISLNPAGAQAPPPSGGGGGGGPSWILIFPFCLAGGDVVAASAKNRACDQPLTAEEARAARWTCGLATFRIVNECRRKGAKRSSG